MSEGRIENPFADWLDERTDGTNRREDLLRLGTVWAEPDSNLYDRARMFRAALGEAWAAGRANPAVALLEVVGDMARCGIGVTVNGPGEFSVSGFYKSDLAKIVGDGSLCVVRTRYDEVERCEIEDLPDTMIELNRGWWERSRDRFHGWAKEDPGWVSYRRFVEGSRGDDS